MRRMSLTHRQLQYVSIQVDNLHYVILLFIMYTRALIIMRQPNFIICSCVLSEDRKIMFL